MIRLEKCKKVHNFKRNNDTDYKGDPYPWVPNPDASIDETMHMNDIS